MVNCFEILHTTFYLQITLEHQHLSSEWQCVPLERVSIECRKTKTKVITLAYQKDRDNLVNQSRLEVIIRSRHKARENVHAQATIGFAFTSDWLKKWRENFQPITE